MRKIRYGVFVLWMLLCCSVTPAPAGVSIGIGIGLPNVSIGINLPLFPELVPVPGYPVYYAPRVGTNYFFYDGMYWVYQNDNWYASYWYNGPWSFVEPAVVPLYVLRIPVRYYRHPPSYFRGWRTDAPPRWGEHWGREWEQHRRGWDNWKRGSGPKRAPLPVYQRQYKGDRYPPVERQQTLRNQHYRYQPRDTAVRQHFQQQGGQRGPAPVRQEKREEPRMKSQGQQQIQRQAPVQQGTPAAPRQQQREIHREQRQQPAAVPAPRQQIREQQQQERGRSQEFRGQGQGQEQKKEEGRGRERN